MGRVVYFWCFATVPEEPDGESVQGFEVGEAHEWEETPDVELILPVAFASWVCQIGEYDMWI